MSDTNILLCYPLFPLRRRLKTLIIVCTLRPSSFLALPKHVLINRGLYPSPSILCHSCYAPPHPHYRKTVTPSPLRHLSRLLHHTNQFSQHHTHRASLTSILQVTVGLWGRGKSVELWEIYQAAPTLPHRATKVGQWQPPTTQGNSDACPPRNGSMTPAEINEENDQAATFFPTENYATRRRNLTGLHLRCMTDSVSVYVTPSRPSSCITVSSSSSSTKV